MTVGVVVGGRPMAVVMVVVQEVLTMIITGARGIVASRLTQHRRQADRLQQPRVSPAMLVSPVALVGV